MCTRLAYDPADVHAERVLLAFMLVLWQALSAGMSRNESLVLRPAVLSKHDDASLPLHRLQYTKLLRCVEAVKFGCLCMLNRTC